MYLQVSQQEKRTNIPPTQFIVFCQYKQIGYCSEETQLLQMSKSQKGNFVGTVGRVLANLYEHNFDLFVSVFCRALKCQLMSISKGELRRYSSMKGHVCRAEPGVIFRTARGMDRFYDPKQYSKNSLSHNWIFFFFKMFG